ncbi:MAG: DUF366 family protein [Cyanobacteria bacterium]|nr:DUF366 family protein [Cyanobacteriota bacterium]
MKYHFIEEELPYTGDELSNHWIYKNFGILGDAVVAFSGPCDIDQQKMVDLEDVLNNDFIYSPMMLNFIVEVFGISLQEGVLLQRLYSSIIQSKLNIELNGDFVKRRGDDLFFEETKKLSVSICTVSPTSILIHTGLNIDATGAPVEAAGLSSDMGLENIETLAMSCMKTLAEEWEDIKLCCCKVRAVM